MHAGAVSRLAYLAMLFNFLKQRPIRFAAATARVAEKMGGGNIRRQIDGGRHRSSACSSSIVKGGDLR